MYLWFFSQKKKKKDQIILNRLYKEREREIFKEKHGSAIL